MMAPNTAETLAFLRLKEVEREWKMAALAAQIPPSSRPSFRDWVAHALYALANRLDPELAASQGRIASASL